MKNYLLAVLTLSCTLSLNAQFSFNCLPDAEGERDGRVTTVFSNGTCQLNEFGLWEVYNDMNLYIPNLDSLLPLHVPPIKTVQLNVNIIQNADGTGNFEDNQVFRSRMRAIINNINNIYSCYAPSDPISWVQELPDYDSRIRFSIGSTDEERIFFYQDSILWNRKNVSLAEEYLRENYPERLENINIYIFGNSNPTNNYASAHTCSWTNFFESQYVKAYYWVPAADWGISMLWAHEFAHLFGLKHTYVGGNGNVICDQNDTEFLKDVFLISLPSVSNCPHQCDPHANPYNVVGDDITNNIVGGSESELYISPMQAGQMHRATCLTSVRKYIVCEKSEVPLVIIDDQLWDFDIKLYQDLIIERGATLTLTCHLVMHPDTKIIVKQGGRLIIDGATIGTDLFEKKLWQGIEVWGNRNENQFLVNGNYRQGYLELKNGAIIENALCAVELGRPGYRSSTGGIIHSEDATFRNNAKAIRAMSYINIDPSTNLEVNYNAYFRKCSFEINQPFLGNAAFYNHVDLNLVKGVSFAGCSFSADRNLLGVNSCCSGIIAYDAGFEVTYSPLGYRDDSIRPNYISSSFSGFYTGIRSANTGINNNTFIVRRSVFNGNKCGIAFKNNGYASIIQNSFYIGDDSGCSFGIFADNVKGFIIEDNFFNSTQNTLSATYGIGIRNTSSINDISLNSFENLLCANVAIGHNNGSAPNLPNGVFGLTYSCNTNEDNVLDFYVIGEDDVVSGICRYQGSMNLPAANAFSGSQYHFYNGGDYMIDYYYENAQNQVPDLSKVYQINAIVTANNNDCLSRYSDGERDITRTSEELYEMENEYHFAFQSYEALLQQYENLIDGGNTNYIISMIERATSDEVDQIRSLLISLSPYLSDEVLIALVNNEEVFGIVSIFDILIANPDVLKNESFIKFLESKEQIMSDEMITQLRQKAFSATDRTELLSQIGRYCHDYVTLAGDIVRSYLNDTIVNSTIISKWLGNIFDISSDRMRVSSYIKEGNFEEALELARLLPELYSFDEFEWSDQTDYLRLLDLYQTLYYSGRSYFEMTELEVEMIQEIVEEGIGFSQSLAEAILSEIQYRDILQDVCPTLPEVSRTENRNTTAVSETSTNGLWGVGFSVSPTPATTWIKIEYVLPNNKDRGVLYLSNAMGVKVLEVELEGNQDSKVIDIQNLSSGIYLLVLQCDEYVKTEKFVIAK